MRPTAYPLTWPATQPRTREPHRSRFDRDRSFAVANDHLRDQLRKLGARNLTVSTNLMLKSNGQPYSGQRQPDDVGVAVYFQGVGIDGVVVLACDQWNRVEDNVTAIAKHIEAMRGQERWGVGSIAQAFAGYALPAPKRKTWHDVLGIPDNAVVDAAVIERRFVLLAKQRHPDVEGGSHEAMTALNLARDEALREVG